MYGMMVARRRVVTTASAIDDTTCYSNLPHGCGHYNSIIHWGNLTGSLLRLCTWLYMARSIRQWTADDGESGIPSGTAVARTLGSCGNLRLYVIR